MKKRLASLLAFTAVLAAGTVLAAGVYSVISIPEPGTFQASGVSVGKVKAIQIEGAYPTNSTVIISRISDDGSVTNALLTRTDVNGSFAGDIGDGTNIWIMAGDKLLRSGTVTNTCRVRLILEGD